MKLNRTKRRCPTVLITLAVVSIAFVISTSRLASAPPAGWRDRALAYADSEHMFGKIVQAGPAYSGSYIGFRFDQTNATISQYILRPSTLSTLVFDAVSPDGISPGIATLNGSLFQYSSSAVDISVHNNPTSAILLKSNTGFLNITFALAANIDARRYGGSLNLSAPGFTGNLIVTGSATLSLTGLDAIARLPPGTGVIFRSNAVAGEGVAGGSGQTALANATLKHVLALESFEVGVEGFIEVSDDDFSSAKLLDSNQTLNGVALLLQADIATPWLAAFHLHDSVLHLSNDSKIIVKLDGSEVQELSSLDGIVNLQGGTSAFAKVVGTKGALFLIYVPQQGTHTLIIEKAFQSTGGEGLNTIQILAVAAVILVILGIATTVMLRRRPRF